MKIFTSLFVIIFLALSLNAQAQEVNPNWKTELASSVESFKSCTGEVVNYVDPCSKFAGESVNTVYKVNDFYSQDRKRYLTGSEIAGFLAESAKWSKLGAASSQETLNAAQKAANENKAVVAVFADAQGIGNMALILPGSTNPSGSWGLSVPNSAAFFMNSKGRSYSDKGLSYAFSKSMLEQVIIYVRSY